jgi:prepilin-type N-terminal cleavage/methylation domain-containing protein
MRRYGFTIIELIITTLILAVILVSIYSAFNIGIKAWKKGNEGQDIQKIRSGLLKIQKELRASFFFSKVPFQGSSKEIIFPLSVPDGDAEKVYIISYSVGEDANLERLMRKEEVFTERLEEAGEPIERVLFSAGSIRFEYAYRLEDGSEGYEWKDLWATSQGDLPSAVRIFFKLKDGSEIYNKTIFIPHGALGVQ